MSNYPIYIFFSLAPSIAWLLFFLKKDKHPESKRMILKIFFYGIITALLTILIELGFAQQIEKFQFSTSLSLIIYVFLGIALVEEMMKYLAVRTQILRHQECDEPVDVMLYMIISALGFAALENLFILFPPVQFFNTLATSIFRFVGATFLHALCSGLIGYFLVLSFLHLKRRFILRYTGFGIAVALHGLYDFSIIKIASNLKFVIPIIILSVLAVLVSLWFNKAKKMKSICLPIDK